jgi:hypothetical protein
MQRFWAKADRRGDAECWEWVACRTAMGYGRFVVDRRVRAAHRVAYELSVGPIPEGLEIDHLCRNRACVNPAHLEAVSHRVNVLRGTAPAAVNKRKTHCPCGREYGGLQAHKNLKNGKTHTSRVCLRCASEKASEKGRYLRAQKRAERATSTQTGEKR